MEHDDSAGAVAGPGAPPPPLEVEVFRAGDYGDKGRYAAADLDALAARYGADGHEAPVTLDHAQEGPAHGWVAQVRRRGEVLVARLRGVSAELRAALAAGRYRKPSIELDFGAAAGALRLRAVSFLGARVPEVKGLAAPLFGESEGEGAEVVRIDFAEAAAAAPPPAEPVPGADALENNESPESSEAAPRDTVARLNEAIDRLRRAGTWSPAWERRGLRRFLETICALGPADDGAPSPLEWFLEFATTSRPSVPLGEAAAARFDDARGEDGAAGEGSWPNRAAASARVSPASLALHEAALRRRQAQPELSYAEAVRRAASGRPFAFRG